MSESIGKPWINSAVINVLVQHAHELPSPALLKGRTQIAQFLTFREDTSDGSQPKDRETPLWAEISDGQCLIPARIASEAVNLIEDATGKALTHYRRGFFTLGGALAYDFVPQQVPSPGGKPHIKKSSVKHVFIDITELRYISGGGPGCPLVQSGVTLQTSNEISDWEKMLTVGGQTLVNKQRQTKIALEAARAAKASSKPSVATLASKRASKAPVKTSTHPITPQPSVDKLAALHEWQDSIWGKRSKYVGLNHVFGPRELDIAPDQQAILDEIIEEQIKPATPEEPYDPTNANRRSSVTNRQDELPSFRASQLISSTPLDARPSPGSPATSHLHTFEDSERQPSYEPSSDLDENEEDDNSNSATPVQSPRVSNREAHSSSRIGYYRSPSVDSQAEQPDADEESDSEHSADDDEPDVLLDADDAITERILGGTPVRKDKGASSTPSNSQRKPIVLVPDSDPSSQSQRRTQIRHSSPWDCESVAPSQPLDRLQSPEFSDASPAKGERRFSPTLSSPLTKNTQPMAHSNDGQKSSASSGQGNSQASAAASLPSPPPEARNEPDTVPQRANHVSNEPRPTSVEKTPNPTQETRHEQGTDSQSDRHGQQGAEASNPTLGTVQTVSRKRQRSQSQPDDPSAITPQQNTEHHSSHRQISENKRRRLDQPHPPLTVDKETPRQPSTRSPVPSKAQEEPHRASGSSNSTKPSANNAGQSASQLVIPHDHDAWSTPSWTRLNSGDQRKSEILPKPKPAGPSSLPAVTDHQNKPEARQLLKPKPIVPQANVRKVPQRPVSPDYPPVTASQVADADEDVDPRPLPNCKVEPVTPARRMQGRTSKVAKGNIVAQTSTVFAAPPVPGGVTSTSGASQLIPPRKKVIAPAQGVSNRSEGHSTSARPSEERHSSARNKEFQPLATHSSKLDTGRTTPKSRLDNGADVEPKSTSAVRKPYLGGFQPSLSLDLKPDHTFTWDMWLEVVREADEFWQE